MQPADYRLVRSRVAAGIMIPIKRNVGPRATDQEFSCWLYGQRKLSEDMYIALPRSVSCLLCSHDKGRPEELSLLNVDPTYFLRCLPALDTEQLLDLYSLLDEDRQSYENAIRQQYQSYKQTCMELRQQKRFERDQSYLKR